MRKNSGSVVVLALGICMWASSALATPVDLTTFSIFAENYPASVTVAGGTVTFQENELDSALFFFNDDFFVSPTATWLSFNYDLEWAQDDVGLYLDDDYIRFKVNDDEKSFMDTITGGLYSFDLTPYRGQNISIEWAWLWNGDGSSTSVARVYNIDMASATGNTGGNPVPEPASMLLLGTGIAGLFGARRMRAAKAGK